MYRRNFLGIYLIDYSNSVPIFFNSNFCSTITEELQSLHLLGLIKDYENDETEWTTVLIIDINRGRIKRTIKIKIKILYMTH